MITTAPIWCVFGKATNWAVGVLQAQCVQTGKTVRFGNIESLLIFLQIELKGRLAEAKQVQRI